MVMRVLVLCGTGFIAPHVIERLYESGHEVTVLRRRPGPAPEGVRVIAGDRNRLTDFAPEFRGLRPDVVVDVIAFTEAQAHGLAAAFTGIAQRAVVLTSGDVYRAYDLFHRRMESAKPDPTPLHELSPLRDRLYPYRGAPAPKMEGTNWDDYDKILVERAVMANPRLPATVLRLPMVYGPGGYTANRSRFWPYVKRMDDGRPAILLDRRTAQWRAPWGYVADIAEAIRLAVESDRAAGEIYNLGDSDRLDIETWVREIAAVVGWRGRIAVAHEPCPPPSLPRTLNFDQNLDMDTAKIRRDLNFRETVSRSAAIGKTVAWYRAHPPAAADPAQFDYAAEDRILARLS